MVNLRKLRVRERRFYSLTTICGLAVIVLTVAIGVFLLVKGSATFIVFGHSIGEFLGSTSWNPVDNARGGGQVGALIFITGSFCACLFALVLATLFALGSAIFMVEMNPKIGDMFFRPVVEIFAGIPSVIYGWMGLTVLIPFLKKLFHLQVGQSVLAAGIVLSLMIYPTITSVSADALKAVSVKCKEASYGLGATRWQTIHQVVVPAAFPGILSGMILGLARALGEALAVAMVIGQTNALPTSLFSQTKTMTTEIAAQMGNAMEGGELKSALWSLAGLLFLLSLVSISLLHFISYRAQKRMEGGQDNGK